MRWRKGLAFSQVGDHFTLRGRLRHRHRSGTPEKIFGSRKAALRTDNNPGGCVSN